VLVAAATGWIVIDKVRCVQLIDHFRLTFLPAAFNPSARNRVYLCFCSGHVHRFLPNASPADEVQGTKLTFDGIFGNFMVGPRVAQEFRLSLDLIFAKKRNAGRGLFPAPQIIVAESSISYPLRARTAFCAIPRVCLSVNFTGKFSIKLGFDASDRRAGPLPC
jgi:hypothetical protein